MTFSSCSIAANSLTCPSATPRSHFPSIAIAVSSPSSRPASARSRSQPPIISSRISAPMTWISVRIRVSLGAMTLPPQRMRRPAQLPQHLLGQVSGLVADLPEGLRPGQRARGGDREHERQRDTGGPGACAGPGPGPAPPAGREPSRPPVRSLLVTAVMRACDTGIGGLSFRSDLA